MSVDKDILFQLLLKKVRDSDLLWLARVIIFHNSIQDCAIKGKRDLFKYLPPHKSLFHRPYNKGLPVGNLTSQFFANVYLNELDQFAKHALKCRHYIRYCDDFLLFDNCAQMLKKAKEEIKKFLTSRLALTLNEKYARIMPVDQGIDFLGYIIRPDYILVRRRVVNNMKARLRHFEKKMVVSKNGRRIIYFDYDLLEMLRSVLASYFGHFKWADTFNLRCAILKRYTFLHDFFSFEGRKDGGGGD